MAKTAPELAEVDPHAAMRDLFAQLAIGGEKIEYCGLPYPVPGESLVLEPNHPAADVYKAEADRTGAEDWSKPDPDKPADFRFINRFYSHKYRSEIYVWFENGKIRWGIIPMVHGLDKHLATLGCSVAWSLEAEGKAQMLLGSLLSHYAYRCYLLTGMFLESSPRSGVFYLFRRLRPTIAMSGRSGNMKIIASMCMHPLGYYQDTFAGGLVPTDDVIAHLLLMRSDEHLYWKRCNQHQAWSPAAGI